MLVLLVGDERQLIARLQGRDRLSSALDMTNAAGKEKDAALSIGGLFRTREQFDAIGRTPAASPGEHLEGVGVTP